jgi:hypothetical protein
LASLLTKARTQAVSLEQLLGAHPVATAIIGHLRPWETVLAARETCRTFCRAIDSYMKGEAFVRRRFGAMDGRCAAAYVCLGR